MATINGGSGDDTLNGTGDADHIDGQGGNDSIQGSGERDTLQGGDGNDTIDGGSENDTVYGGDGDDSITGGSGDDVIVGGRGNDTMAAGSGSTTDTFVIRDGDGTDTITDFDPDEPDIIAFDMVEMNTFQDVLDRITTDGPDTIITYDNGSSVRLQNVNPADLSSTNFQFAAGPVCFHAGTLIKTIEGLRPIETLVPGVRVKTLDHGWQPLLQVVVQSLRFGGRPDRAQPIEIKADALGAGSPARTLIVSPQHRFLVLDPATGEEILVPAVKLLGRRGVRRMSGRSSARYFNLLLPHHEVIMAEGCLAETLLVTPFTRGYLNAGLCNRVRDMTPARPILRYDPAQQPMPPLRRQAQHMARPCA